MNTYVVEGLDLSTGRFEPIAYKKATVRVLVDGLQVSITAGPSNALGDVRISVDPINGEAIGINVDEVHVHRQQARLGLTADRGESLRLSSTGDTVEAEAGREPEPFDRVAGVPVDRPLPPNVDPLTGQWNGMERVDPLTGERW